MTPPNDTADIAILDATGGPVDGGPESLWPGGTRYTAPLGGAPLIAHVLAELPSAGIGRVQVIAPAGRGGALRDALAGCQPGGPQTSVTEASPRDGARGTLLAALDQALGSGPVLLRSGEALFGDGVATMTARYRDGDVDAVLPAETSVTAPSDPAIHPLTRSAVVLGPGTRPLVRELRDPRADDEDLIEVLLHSDQRLAVTELAARWCYDDSLAALLAGNRTVLDALPDAALAAELREANELHGRIHIGLGVFISGCVVHGPVAIAARAVLEDSFIGPYTSIGSGAVLSGAEIDNAMVLDGAEIRHPGQRIVASIIGERARVTRRLELPQGMHLRLGPDSQVTFS